MLISKNKKMVIIMTIIFAIVISFYSCTIRERIHYLDKSKYITSVGLVTFINFSDTDKCLNLAIEGMEHIYGDIRFKISGTNYQIVVENGIKEKLSIHREIEFTASPGVFGDGYAIPIVSIRIDGEELLAFEDGYKNLINERSVSLMCGAIGGDGASFNNTSGINSKNL